MRRALVGNWVEVRPAERHAHIRYVVGVYHDDGVLEPAHERVVSGNTVLFNVWACYEWQANVQIEPVVNMSVPGSILL